jgi:aspartyl-tRNA(Asn)/glutamyl-tRNA(Gln) amidotransferase subunit C
VDALTRDDVEQIALLARLALDDRELEEMRVDLTAILGHMDVLAEVDTTGVEPMTHAVPMALPLREDRVLPSLSVDQALAAAPDKQDDCFRVPAAIKGGK